MFAIEFVQDEPPVGRSRIRIGDFTEALETSLEYWSRPDYERQWLAALECILSGGERSALITSMTDPRTANLLFWWPVHLVGDDVFFQSGVLFLDQLAGPFDPAHCEEFVDPREQTAESGEPLSEWRVSTADLRRFVAASRT